MKKEAHSGMDERNLVSSSLSCRNEKDSLQRGYLSSGEYSVDANMQGREEGSGDPPHSDHDLLESTILNPPKGIDRFDVKTVESLEDNRNTEISHYFDSSKLRDIDVTGPDDGQEEFEFTGGQSNLTVALKEGTEPSNFFDIEADPGIWLPPEPEDVQDGTEGSVANYENDDEYIGGSLSFRFQEEFSSTMSKVKNGRFKSLVSRLLNSGAISFSGEAGENWVDIVTFLAWEAALFIKPNAAGEETMGPEAYVKVKCVSTGTRSQSELVKGLVFKKNASHKHMPTKWQSPRLLLLQGNLDHTSGGISSFDSMEQEKNNLRAITEMIEKGHPNVVLVEKTVSRDVQELLLAKAITLVFDMKLHRLERIALCTGSRIFSFADSLMSQELKQCTSFHLDKFVEGDGISMGGGKRLSKTLMFLEGCHRPLGCTVLLKGASSDELKKIKCVVHCAVVVAYHLILETSFLLDQMALFSTVDSRALSEYPKQSQILVSGTSSERKDSCTNESLTQYSSSFRGIPISDGFEEKPAYERTLCNSDLNSEEMESRSLIPIDRSVYAPASKPAETLSDCINMILDAQSILYLASSQSVLKRTTCKQNHLFRIKYYKNFDVILGQFLCDNLLNQKKPCAACGDPPEAHLYTYVHQSGKLTVRVKQLAIESCLPGEEEGKLWMWAKCSKCEPIERKQGATRRVVMSTAARCLSFGKFLELSFSVYFSSSKLSSCGHSLDKDYLRFYGLGCMVSMFRYSEVDIYMACMSPPVLGFNNSIGEYWIQQEAAYVLKKGMLLFSEISNLLRSKPLLDLTVRKEYSKVEEMLMTEKSDFQGHIQEVAYKNQSLRKVVYELLNLNQIIQELVLESYVWDRRIRSLLSFDLEMTHGGDTHKAVHEDVRLQQCTDVRLEKICNTSHYVGKVSDVTASTVDACVSSKAYISAMLSKSVNTSSIQEVELESNFNQTSILEKEISVKEVQDSQQCDGMVLGSVHLEAISSTNIHATGSTTTRNTGVSESSLDVLTASAAGVLDGPFLSEDSSNALRHSPNFEASKVQTTVSSITELFEHLSLSQRSLVAELNDSEDWIWSPFSEIRRAFRKDLQNSPSEKFDFINNYTAKCLTSASRLMDAERNRLHVPVGLADNIVSAYDGELSSIIACALALMHDKTYSEEMLVEKEARKGEGEDEKAIDSAPYRLSDVSVLSPSWSSTDSLDSDVTHSKDTAPSESSFNLMLDPLNPVDSQDPHPEIHLGVGKLCEKGKYSVICLYAKDFRALRRRCFARELDYIASLSRCKNWDAKGGKSGSVFVKTLDDRFVIKQIKKIEFDSFVKFAPDYFNYINHSFSSGSQTCLAKILGIYQVTIRPGKHGRDIKYDLMVMENVLFGRNIARTYDLKGAKLSRYISGEADGVGNVYLDQNFVEDTNTSPLYLSVETKRLLQRAIWNDTCFLTSINVMDYSVLVGVDTQRRELACGIIDYLRQYTWDKQIESLAKSAKASLVVPRNVTPTVVPPKDYKKRLRKFMSAHFLSIPDDSCPL